jgi:hypothetical protein
MDNNTNELDETTKTAEPEIDPEKAVVEQVRQWYYLTENTLKENFPEYLMSSGNIGLHPQYGYLFSFQLNKDDKTYSCGFILREVVDRFMSNREPEQWLCSFFIDKIDNDEPGPFPKTPSSEEEFKQMVDDQVVPLCIQNIHKEFPEDNVQVDLDVHPEHGPVLEAGFPNLKEGNNTAAVPLMYLITLYMLNRDPSEPLVAALYRVLDEQKANV